MLFRRVTQVPNGFKTQLSQELLEGLALPILRQGAHISPFVYRTPIVEENDYWIEYQKLMYHLRFFMKPIKTNFYVNTQQTVRCDTRLIRTWCKLDTANDTIYTLSLMENIKYNDRYLCINNYYDLVSNALWSPELDMLMWLDDVNLLKQTVNRHKKQIEIDIEMR
jgi:hypothetical protein